MADAVMVSVAKAITKELNTASSAGSFDRRFTAERSYLDWSIELEDLSEVHVDVVPVSERRRTFTRGTWLYIVTTQIAVRFRFASQEQDATTGRIDATEVDQLVRLAEQIGEYFAGGGTKTLRKLTDVPAAIWKPEGGEDGTEFQVLFVPEHLKLLRQFTAIIALTYAVTKAPA